MEMSENIRGETMLVNPSKLAEWGREEGKEALPPAPQRSEVRSQRSVRLSVLPSALLLDWSLTTVQSSCFFVQPCRDKALRRRCGAESSDR